MIVVNGKLKMEDKEPGDDNSVFPHFPTSFSFEVGFVELISANKGL